MDIDIRIKTCVFQKIRICVDTGQCTVSEDLNKNFSGALREEKVVFILLMPVTYFYCKRVTMPSPRESIFP